MEGEANSRSSRVCAGICLEQTKSNGRRMAQRLLVLGVELRPAMGTLFVAVSDHVVGTRKLPGTPIAGRSIYSILNYEIFPSSAGAIRYDGGNWGSDSSSHYLAGPLGCYRYHEACRATV